jgi:peptidoglycan/xylan/chitin deacetylase (PgdA/CDA1 family)
MRKFSTLASCIAAAAIAMTGCSVAASTPPSPDALQSIAPVNNSVEAIKTCNRQPGSGVLMTFDDYGTDDQVTAILEKLRQHHMRAAFFPTGSWAEEHLYLIDQMKIDGHIVGNHTQTHADLAVLSATNEATFYGEIYPLKNVANTDPMLLRHPFGYGSEDESVNARLSERNIQGCTWTVDSHDWAGDSVEVMMNRIRSGDQFSSPIRPDGVILAHMHGLNTLALIDPLVQYLNEKGMAYEHTA